MRVLLLIVDLCLLNCGVVYDLDLRLTLDLRRLIDEVEMLSAAYDLLVGVASLVARDSSYFEDLAITSVLSVKG